MQCSIEGCDNSVHSKALCQAHYRQQARRAKDPLVGTRRRGPSAKPGAVSHQKLDPEERDRRRREREAARTHCINGHEFSEKNTYIYPESSSSPGKKVCKICQRNAFQLYHGRPVAGDVPVGIRNSDKTHCPQGHSYEEFGYTKSDGARGCRPCHNWNQRSRTYDITREEYAALVLVQHNCCAICTDEFVRTPHIDHDHSSGAVRGLLCGPCNNGLGNFRDDEATLEAAIEYLRLFNEDSDL